MRKRHIRIDGIHTQYFDEGEGPAILLLHSGEFGGCAELSWENNFPVLAQRFRVVAPDWLGYGGTDKLYEFGRGRGRMLDHMARFVETLELKEAHYVGNSMGGGLIVNVIAERDPRFTPRSLTLASSGGFSPDNEYRRAMLGFDGTKETMMRMLASMFHSDRLAKDEAYAERRIELAMRPGVWEAAAAPRFKAPNVPERLEFGQPDVTKYENIDCPTLIIAGDQDRLREPGYTDDMMRRIPRAELQVFKDSGHCANIEFPERFNATVADFIERVEAGAFESK